MTHIPSANSATKGAINEQDYGPGGELSDVTRAERLKAETAAISKDGRLGRLAGRRWS